MMRGTQSYLIALLGVATIAMITYHWLALLGLASAALLFLLPVLFVAALGGRGPGLFAATMGALAYNFFLLPPRFTLRIHGLDNVVSVIVLFAVALVTSRLANALRAREVEAEMRANANAQLAMLSALLGRGNLSQALESALDWLCKTYGQAQIIAQGQLPEDQAGFSTLDLTAAAWAMHNGDLTGHGTTIMPAADWSFVPLNSRMPGAGDLLAVARPTNTLTRTEADIAQLASLARLLGQARDRMALEEEHRARERLEHRDALRRTLLASIAHDFRTPLTVVAGELERLARQDDGAADALTQARRLDRMMDDLIGAARIESGDLSPRREAVDLIDLVNDARLALSHPLASLHVTQDVSSDLPLVDADPVLLRHILINLLDNAARHCAASIAIKADTIGNTITLAIEDDGPGIAPAERERIFERFTRIEGSDRRGGSGLGLAIVKGFADAMDMTVDVQAGSKGGATFQLQLTVHEFHTP